MAGKLLKTMWKKKTLLVASGKVFLLVRINLKTLYLKHSQKIKLVMRTLLKSWMKKKSAVN